MAIKLAFGIPMALGTLAACIIGIQTDWSSDLWGLPLFLGALLSVSMGLVVRRAQKGGRLYRRPGEQPEPDDSPRMKLIVEAVLFLGLLACITLPLSGKRGILIGGEQITTRSILVVGALLVGPSLLVRIIKWLRGRNGAF